MSDGRESAVARVWVTRLRFRHPVRAVTGRLRRVRKEGTRAHGARVRRRAEQKVGRFYVIITINCYMGPYRTQGTTGPAGGGPRGRQGRLPDPTCIRIRVGEDIGVKKKSS